MLGGVPRGDDRELGPVADLGELVVAAVGKTVLHLTADQLDGRLVQFRLLVGPPFTPREVLPMVEVVPGERTEPWAVEAAVDFYRDMGKKPVVLHKEINGFVANRLQSTLFRECVWLVSQGVVSAAELDQIVTESIGIRWATAGPFESFHLGGGPGGMRHFLEHLGPGMARRWKIVEQPELDEATVELISGQVEDRFADRSYDQLTEVRDRAQLAVIAARDAARQEGTGR